MPPPPFNQMFPPAPTFTEKDVGDLSGKTVLVTGTSSGVGLELAKMLYGAGATIFMGARSADKNKRAIKTIEAEIPQGKGRMIDLRLDLSDLSSIKTSAEKLISQSDRLDVVVHNAGIMTPPVGSKTELGHDLEMGTNCLGPFLLNGFLESVLKRTAASAPSDSVRIIWVSSMVALSVPQDGIVWDEKSGQPKVLKNQMETYMESKVGNMFIASQLAARLSQDGIINLAVHPGIVRSGLQRNGSPMPSFVMNLLFKPAKYGAYTELFAGFSPKITMKDNGKFIIPWGRFGPIPEHIQMAMKSKTKGGTGNSDRFLDWCQEEVRPYT